MREHGHTVPEHFFTEIARSHHLVTQCSGTVFLLALVVGCHREDTARSEEKRIPGSGAAAELDVVSIATHTLAAHREVAEGFDYAVVGSGDEAEKPWTEWPLWQDAMKEAAFRSIVEGGHYAVVVAREHGGRVNDPEGDGYTAVWSPHRTWYVFVRSPDGVAIALQP